MGNIYISKVTKAGQVSLPKSLRAELQLSEEEYVSMEPRGNVVVMQKVQRAPMSGPWLDGEAMGFKRSDVDKAIKSVRKTLAKEWRKT